MANSTSNLPLDSAKDLAAVLVNAISEVLAGHADTFALPAFLNLLTPEDMSSRRGVQRFGALAIIGNPPILND